MIRIGICDDIEKEVLKIEQLCRAVFEDKNIQCHYIKFYSGEEVLEYCENPENERIDLLFLDVEMSGISGLELKDRIIQKSAVWRIAFVTSYEESVYGAFSLKTIGFIKKPATEKEIEKMINIVRNDLKENVVMTYKDYRGEVINIPIESIFYFVANESYSIMHTEKEENINEQGTLLCKKLGVIEKELQKYGFIRVHKSYLVNFANVIELGENIVLRKLRIKIPVGRKYKEQVRMSYLEYGKERVRQRL